MLDADPGHVVILAPRLTLAEGVLRHRRHAGLAPAVLLGQVPDRSQQPLFRGPRRSWGRHIQEIVGQLQASCEGGQVVAIDPAFRRAAAPPARESPVYRLFVSLWEAGICALPVVSRGCSLADRAAMQAASATCGNQRWVLRFPLTPLDRHGAAEAACHWLERTARELQVPPEQITALIDASQLAAPHDRHTAHAVEAVAASGPWRHVALSAGGRVGACLAAGSALQALTCDG
ncbi:hypothetical protein [Ideonella sp.]|uniref:hypothetical protein n=1 Tax=Ideonella sp. TaxID=1929293 RepID=UPI0035B343A0